MKSIRLSLILYLLLLLTAALGAVLFALYQTTYQTLGAKKEKTEELLDEEVRNRRRDVLEYFDNQLLRAAQTLANQAQSQWTQTGPMAAYPVKVVTAGLSPLAPLLVPLWLAEGPDGNLAMRLQHGSQGGYQVWRPLGFLLNTGMNPNGGLLLASWIAAGYEGQAVLRTAWQPPLPVRFEEGAVGRGSGGGPREFFQIYNDQGVPLQRSRSMGQRSFTLNPALRDKPLFKESFDDTELRPGKNVRRVTLKVPASTIHVRVVPPGNGGGGTGRFQRTGPLRRRELTSHTSPVFFIQYACETTERDQALMALESNRRFKRAGQEQESADAIASLKEQLSWIGLAAFAASMVGGCWLIGVGLAPLRRLSEAVSRVSERDFRVPIDAGQLPVELRPILDRLSKTLEQLKRAFAREKQAAADMSHELRTPLAALLTTIEVGLRRPRTAEQYVELLGDAHAIGRQMSQLVEQLLALARIDAGADSVRSQVVDVPALAKQCVDLIRPLAEARDLKLALTCADVPHLRTDPGKLREVLINLLHNAVEYNRPGGRIELALERKNGAIRVDVSDTGIGIPPRALEHIFERFYRVDESRQADSLHAGVGLAIVKGYLELIGGQIAVESAPGKGSTFTLHLPIR